MAASQRSISPPLGRGTGLNPPNRFERLSVGPPPEDLAEFFEGLDPDRREPTVYLKDDSRSILSQNDSPDVGFEYSINPYRGCLHGCVYCYARPSHEYLGYSSGLDFETRILVKEDAPELLAKAFSRKSWTPQPVALSGNTDCYQPVERQLEITRRILGVFLRYRNPVMIVTKNSLIRRDIDILRELARMDLVSVSVSVTTLRQEIARRMEPRTSSIAQRFRTMQELSAAGVPVGVLVAPLIPGLTDEEIPDILGTAAFHGAGSAAYLLMRLPHAVKEVFLDWVQQTLPERAPKILSRIREVREGKLSDAAFGTRMRGTGPVATSIHDLFKVSATRAGLSGSQPPLSTSSFTRRSPGQGSLFDS